MNPIETLSSVFGIIPLLVFLILALYILGSSVRILPEYERAVIFRLGRLAKAVMNIGGTGNGPGLILLIPIIDRMVKVSLRSTRFRPSSSAMTSTSGLSSRALPSSEVRRSPGRARRTRMPGPFR